MLKVPAIFSLPTKLVSQMRGMHGLLPESEENQCMNTPICNLTCFANHVWHQKSPTWRQKECFEVDMCGLLQVRLEAMEKENSSLKYDVHVLNKELEIRSQEREIERKAADNADKQQLESVKKIAKLEEECNRLRVLIRKKLPGDLPK